MEKNIKYKKKFTKSIIKNNYKKTYNYFIKYIEHTNNKAIKNKLNDVYMEIQQGGSSNNKINSKIANVIGELYDKKMLKYIYSKSKNDLSFQEFNNNFKNNLNKNDLIGIISEGIKNKFNMEGGSFALTLGLVVAIYLVNATANVIGNYTLFNNINNSVEISKPTNINSNNDYETYQQKIVDIGELTGSIIQNKGGKIPPTVKFFNRIQGKRNVDGSMNLVLVPTNPTDLVMNSTNPKDLVMNPTNPTGQVMNSTNPTDLVMNPTNSTNIIIDLNNELTNDEIKKISTINVKELFEIYQYIFSSVPKDSPLYSVVKEMLELVKKLYKITFSTEDKDKELTELMTDFYDKFDKLIQIPEFNKFINKMYKLVVLSENKEEILSIQNLDKISNQSLLLLESDKSSTNSYDIQLKILGKLLKESSLISSKYNTIVPKDDISKQMVVYRGKIHDICVDIINDSKDTISNGNVSKELVTTSKELVTTSKELVTTSTELVPTSTELVPTSTELVPTSTELVPVSKELASVLTEQIVMTTSLVEISTKLNVSEQIKNGTIILETLEFFEKEIPVISIQIQNNNNKIIIENYINLIATIAITISLIIAIIYILKLTQQNNLNQPKNITNFTNNAQGEQINPANTNTESDEIKLDEINNSNKLDNENASEQKATELESDAESDAESEQKATEPESNAESDAKSEPESDAEPEQKATEPESDAESDAKSEPESNVESDAKSELESNAKLESELESNAKLESEPEQKAKKEEANTNKHNETENKQYNFTNKQNQQSQLNNKSNINNNVSQSTGIFTNYNYLFNQSTYNKVPINLSNIVILGESEIIKKKKILNDFKQPIIFDNIVIID